MDLFEATENPHLKPLAERLRPSSLKDIVGQKKALHPRSPLIKRVEQGLLPNLIIWGPPGTGKTSFALLLCEILNFDFVVANAIDTGVKKIRDLGNEAHQKKITLGRQTVLFIDEIHRLNKSQQDILLPFTEKGDLILIGATTENPSYELNSALMSRCQLLVFERLEEEDLKILVFKALNSFDLKPQLVLSESAIKEVIGDANGDARKLLNTLDAILTAYNGSDSDQWDWPLVPEQFYEFFKNTSLYYDKASDSHYDAISAFIKSVRGSDPDAAVYYLARMVASGEDPVFIARRLVILASEDIGNADPKGLPLAMATMEAVKAIGLPEAGICLAQATTYLSSAPKSNRSYLSYKKALSEVNKSGNLEVPKSLRSAKTKLMKDIGYGKGYKYSHDGEKAWQEQTFLPDKIKDIKFYEPSERGFEKNISAYLRWMKS